MLHSRFRLCLRRLPVSLQMIAGQRIQKLLIRRVVPDRSWECTVRIFSDITASLFHQLPVSVFLFFPERIYPRNHLTSQILIILWFSARQIFLELLLVTLICYFSLHVLHLFFRFENFCIQTFDFFLVLPDCFLHLGYGFFLRILCRLHFFLLAFPCSNGFIL